MAPSSTRASVTTRKPAHDEAVTEALPPLDTNATRHLSAGAYLDSEFCLTALREVYYQPKRVAAPSHGFDVVTVLGHCLRARRAMIVRDGLILSLLLLASWLSVAGTVLILAALLAVHLLAVAAGVARSSMAYLRASMPIRDGLDRADDDHLLGDRWRRRRGVLGQPSAFRRLWLENLYTQFAGRVLGVAGAYALMGGGAVLLATSVWHASLFGQPRFGVAASVVTGYLAALVFLVPMGTRAWCRLQLRALVPDRTVVRPVATRRLREIDSQTGGNTVVYSGYFPFVGSGRLHRRWTLAQRLVRPATLFLGEFDRLDPLDGVAARPDREELREFSKPPFTASEISAHVRDHIAGLANDAVPERRIPALTVSDLVFVAGTEVSDLQPYTSPARMSEIIRNPTVPERHYLACQVVSWRGELVTTVYVHFAVQGRSLYVEFNVTWLPPCDSRFRVVDQVGGTGVKALLRDVAWAVVEAPGIVASAPVGLVRAGMDALGLVAARDLASRRVRRGLDYGAETGVREIGAVKRSPRDLMQRQDVIKYARLIERRVFASILDFLERRGVDVTEFQEHSTSILNTAAVAVGGGTVNIGGSAAGVQVNTDVGGDTG